MVKQKGKTIFLRKSCPCSTRLCQKKYSHHSTHLLKPYAKSKTMWH